MGGPPEGGDLERQELEAARLAFTVAGVDVSALSDEAFAAGLRSLAEIQASADQFAAFVATLIAGDPLVRLVVEAYGANPALAMNALVAPGVSTLAN